MDFEESHGLFQRNDTAIIEIQEARIKPEYKVKVVTDAYFLSTNESDILNPTRFSANDILSSVSYLYLKKDYISCSTLAERFISSILPKVNFEVSETAAKCYFALCNYSKSLELMGYALKRSDPHSLFFLGKLYRLNGMPNESLLSLRKYCYGRSEDSYTWHEIGLTLLNYSSINSKDFEGINAIDFKICAHRCFTYAIHLLKRFVPSGEFGNKSGLKRMTELEIHLNEIRLGDLPSFSELETNHVEFSELFEWIKKSTIKMDTIYVETVENSNINE